MPLTNGASTQDTVLKAKQIKYEFPGLDVAVCGKWVWISGNTREVHERLSALGLKFSRGKNKWYWAPANHVFRHRRAGVPYPQIVTRYGESVVTREDQEAA